jgi:phosphatidate cytidylyltransferase
MHLKRWITGLVALPPLIWFIYKGGIPFALLVMTACVVGLIEYFQILSKIFRIKAFGVFPAVALATGIAMIWTAHKFSADLVLCILAINLLICALIAIVRFKTDPTVVVQMGVQMVAVGYIPLLLSFAALIRNGSDGMNWFFFVLAVVFSYDIGAFYVGSYWGRHKLCPWVSPGKTIEGVLGGLGASLIVGCTAKFFFFSRMSWTGFLLFWVCMGIAAQAGDLFESLFKRAAQVKDSGGILPGHGGVLDRIDALLFALPVAYYFKKFILWV